MDPTDRPEPPAIPDTVQELLRTRVHNFEALEVLILASGDPKRAWTPAEAATALRWALEPAAQAFQRLQASGLLRSPSPDSYRFEPSTPAVGEAVSELRRCYAADRLAILKFMNSLSLEQMRNAMLRTLAEAFRLRRREP